MTLAADDAVPERSLAGAPLPLAYARLDATGLTELRPALPPLLGVAIGSGLCVGSALLATSSELTSVAVLHAGVYAATLGVAVRGGMRLSGTRLHSAPRTAMDMLAAAGLVVIACAPGVGVVLPGVWGEQAFRLLLAAAFGLMAATTYRHRLLYTALARPFRDAGYRGLARTMSTLGWLKTLYEAAWLACCTLPLVGGAIKMNAVGRSFGDVLVFMAFTAFFGCMGYAVIWVLMIVVHARAVVVARRVTGSVAS